jgi:hypothetical protein
MGGKEVGILHRAKLACFEFRYWRLLAKTADYSYLKIIRRVEAGAVIIGKIDQDISKNNSLKYFLLY